MKKILVFLIIWALLWFVILNYKPFLAYYYNYQWNKFYSNEEFFPSLALHSKAGLLLDKDEFHYNIGNDYFQIWEEQTSTGTQLAYYQISEDKYSKLLEKNDLDLDIYKKVKENYDIVQKKIEELTRKKDEKEEEEEDKEEEQWDEEDESAQNKDEEKKGDEKEKESEEDEEKEKEDENEKKSSDEKSSNNETWEDDESEWDTWEERDIDKNSSGNKSGNNRSQPDQLLPAEKKQIDKYIENLKAQEKQNMQFFNKKSSSSHSVQDTFFNSFSNSSFFDDMFDRWWEKDW